MKFHLWLIGKTQNPHLDALVEMYLQRIARFHPLKVRTFKGVKGLSEPHAQRIIEREERQILPEIHGSDYLILLDERGKQYSSVEFAGRLQYWMRSSSKRCIFLIGGAYGVGPKIRGRADEQLSLSRMTFSHELARLVFAEQLYRAFAILHHHPYHNV